MPRTSLAAAAAYLALAIVLTWPVAAGLGRDVPADVGDPVLNMWILGWNAQHMLRIAGGDIAAFSNYWNANIFYPEPLALAYSEHLIAQSLQILPVYAITGNLILCYNLLFLSTFVLSGLGTFLLVRELTGRPRCAFLAGLFFAFLPYRIAQFSHIQVLSSQWMPFALYGFRRYAVTGRRIALAGAAAALVLQNNSCGYFLMFFAPFAAAYAVVELARHGHARTWRAWRDLAVAGTVVAALTLPFYWPYVRLRALGQRPRPLGELVYFAADVYGYLTAAADLRLWGSVLRRYVKPEGELFPGVIPLALAIVACALVVRRAWPARGTEQPRGRVTRMGARLTTMLQRVAGQWGAVWIVRAIAAIALVHAAAALGILIGAGGRYEIGPLVIRITRLWRTVRIAVGFYLALLLVSPRARAVSRTALRAPETFWMVSFTLAMFLSFGPIITTLGHQVGDGPYTALYEYVPGFDGLRVPARYAMVVSLFLAVLAGYGATIVDRGRRATAWTALIAALFIAEAWAAPVNVNGTWEEDGLQPLTGRLRTRDQVPQVYRFVLRRLPPDAVLVEFPFGAFGYEMRYMYYSTAHWRPLLNGYSGAFPKSYDARRAVLRRPLEEPGRAWRTILASGATHAIVHEGLFLGHDGETISAWLHGNGARHVVSFERDRLFELPKNAD